MLRSCVWVAGVENAPIRTNGVEHDLCQAARAETHDVSNRSKWVCGGAQGIGKHTVRHRGPNAPPGSQTTKKQKAIGEAVEKDQMCGTGFNVAICTPSVGHIGNRSFRCEQRQHVNWVEEQGRTRVRLECTTHHVKKLKIQSKLHVCNKQAKRLDYTTRHASARSTVTTTHLLHAICNHARHEKSE